MSGEGLAEKASDAWHRRVSNKLGQRLFPGTVHNPFGPISLIVAAWFVHNHEGEYIYGHIRSEPSFLPNCSGLLRRSEPKSR